MACLSCQCITKALISASTSANNDSSPSLPPSQSNTTDPKPSIPITKTKTKVQNKRRLQTKLQQQLNLIRIERAIGAGSYRDCDDPTGSTSEQRDSIMKGLLPNNAGTAFEGPVERKLRETGEWLTDKTEGQFRSSGKILLMFIFKWALPIYILMFLVATGIVKLPFSTPLLDDLLM